MFKLDHTNKVVLILVLILVFISRFANANKVSALESGTVFFHPDEPNTDSQNGSAYLLDLNQNKLVRVATLPSQHYTVGNEYTLKGKKFIKITSAPTQGEYGTQESQVYFITADNLPKFTASELELELSEKILDIETWFKNASESLKKNNLENTPNPALHQELYDKFQELSLICDSLVTQRVPNARLISSQRLARELPINNNNDVTQFRSKILSAFNSSDIQLNECEDKIAEAYFVLKNDSSLKKVFSKNLPQMLDELSKGNLEEQKLHQDLQNEIANLSPEEASRPYTQLNNEGTALDYLNNSSQYSEDSNPLVGASQQKYRRGSEDNMQFEDWLTSELSIRSSCREDTSQGRNFTPGVYELHKDKWIWAYSNGKAYKLQNNGNKKLKLYIDNPNNSGTIRATVYDSSEIKYYNFSVPKGAYLNFYNTFKLCSYFVNSQEPTNPIVAPDDSQRSGSVHTSIVPSTPAPKPKPQVKTTSPTPSPQQTGSAENTTPVSQETMDFLSVLYEGTKKYRNSKRTIIGSKASTKSLGRCSMYQLIGLQKHGCINKEIRIDAKYIGNELSKQGFVNLLDQANSKSRYPTLYSFPPGTVLVYSGGDYGHVETRSRFGFISDYFSNNPRTGSKGSWNGKSRRLIGAWVKPSCGAGAI